MIDKVQFYPTPKNVKEVQASVEIWGLGRTFLPYLAQCLHLLFCRVKKGHTWNWGSEQQAGFEKAKILAKPIKGLGISQIGLTFELNMPVTPKDTGGQGRVPLRFWSQFWKGAETQHTP